MVLTKCVRCGSLFLTVVAIYSPTWYCAAVANLEDVLPSRQHRPLITREMPAGSSRGGRHVHSIRDQSQNIVASIAVDGTGSILLSEPKFGTINHGSGLALNVTDGFMSSMSPLPSASPLSLGPAVAVPTAASNDRLRDDLRVGGADGFSSSGHVANMTTSVNLPAETSVIGEGLMHSLGRLIDIFVLWTFPARAQHGWQHSTKLNRASFASVESRGNTVYNHGIHGAELVEVVKDPEEYADVADDEFDKDLPGGHAWFTVLLLLLAFCGIAMPHVGLFLKVELPGERFSADAGDSGDGISEVSSDRGHDCWIGVVYVSMFFLATTVFLGTFVKSAGMNIALREMPEARNITLSSGDSATLGPIDSPGERAFEASAGVLFSMIFACVVLLYRRFVDSVPIRAALLGFFGLRGATLSIVVAGAAELLALSLLSMFTGDGIHSEGSSNNEIPSRLKSAYHSGADLRGMSMMFLVGTVEELAKACVLLGGVVLVATTIRPSESTWEEGCCWSCCQVLVETPRGLMLAGVAAGFGFMTVENGLYLAEVASTPPIAFGDTGMDIELDRFAMRLLRLITVAIRIGLNIHPWLAGITASRVAKILLADDRGVNVNLGVAELSWAITPSAIVHSIYNLLIVAAPAQIALLAPLGFWLFSRSLFDREWGKFNMQAPPPVLSRRSL
eukprot:TRINITY_DN22468_c0_g1_i1.p1 TRINITY_DN22468_c0_g1~~TRINITY_DN22468_c0_g1_i1.p1  ORF type:complete len:676 (-),score=100.43 TRINITY_DN22468_c0_g1_i1:77-2104(-)